MNPIDKPKSLTWAEMHTAWGARRSVLLLLSGAFQADGGQDQG